MFDFINPRHWFQKRASALDDARVRMEQMAQYNALFHLDPDRLVDAITSFNAGDLGQLARIIRDFEERDDKMATCAMKMRASVGRCDYSILVKEGFENDERAKRHAEILKRFWSTVNVTSRFNMNERGGLRLLKKQMMEAQSYGYAVHEIVWRPLPNGEIAAEFIKLPLWHFENRTGELRFLPTETAVEGVPMADGEWLVTTGDGVGIPASICAMAKRMCFQDWLLFSERSGMPIIVGTTGATFRSEQWNNIKGAIRNIYRDTRVLLDSGSRIEAIDTGHAANIPFPALVEWSDRAIAALYRGADLSTISKGDGTGASLQGDEAGMIEQDAAANLGETLHEQVDRFVIRYVTGDDEPLASISIEPVKKPDVDTDIKIDNHLAALGVKLSKADALQRYGRAEATSEEDALHPTPNGPQNGLPGGFGGLPNERPPATPLQTALQGIAKREDESGRTTTPESDGAPQGAILAAFAKDTSAAAERVKALLDDPTPEAADKLLADLPSLIPDDPALAAVIAEAMAAEFGSPAAPDPSGSLANEDQPRGKTTPGTNDGSFSPAGGGGSSESKKAREKREKAERQARHMSQGVSSMQHVLAGNDVENFMPGFKNARVNYTHIAFYQGDSESGYLHIKNHAPDRNGILNHQAMLQGGKIPETIAKGTWYDDGHGIRVVYNDQLVILGKDGDGLRVLSAYVSSEKARSTRSDNRLVRLMNEKEGAL